MTEYEFRVKEVKRDGFTAWNAIEVSTGREFAIGSASTLPSSFA